MSLVLRKPVFGISDQVPHKRGCTATEDGKKLEISDLERRGIVLCICSENKGADQLRGHREADLRLCLRICKKPVFSQRGSYIILNIYCRQVGINNCDTKQLSSSEIFT